MKNKDIESNVNENTVTEAEDRITETPEVTENSGEQVFNKPEPGAENKTSGFPYEVTNFHSAVPGQKKVLRDLSAAFFDPVRVNENDPFRSPLCAVAEILRQQGINGKSLKASILTVLTMLSARLGYPAALILIDKTSKAQSLLPSAATFVPKGSIFESMEMSIDTLYMSASELGGKVIVNPDFSGLKKVKTDLEHLVEHSHVSRQEKVSSKFRKGIEALEIRGPVALVTVSDDPANSDWKGSAVLKIFFNSNEIGSNIQIINNEIFNIESCRIAKSFERLGACKVEIPFMEDIFNKMKETNFQVSETMLKPLINIISIISIINNPAPVFEDEIIASVYGIERGAMRKWLALKGYETDTIPAEHKVKTATKVDYYLASLLLNGRIEAENDTLTERQIRIFSAIKRWNIGRLGSTFTDLENKVEKLATIAKNANCLADRERIFQEVNEPDQDFLTLSTINNELQVLMEMDLIERQKPPKENKYGYFILTLDAGKAITLPHSSEIIDPVYQGKTITVVNPLTGKIDEI